MKTIITLCAAVMLLITSNTRLYSQNITCSSFCVTAINSDTNSSTGGLVSIFMIDSGFINYPHVVQILDASNAVVATGQMFFFGQFGNSTQEYPITTSVTNWSNFVGTVIFLYDNDTCYLPYPCAVNPSSVSESQPLLNVAVYPNPAQNVLYISLPDPALDYNISVVDANGRALFQYNNRTGSSVQIDTRAWPSGIYTVTILSNDGKFVAQRLSVMH